MLRARWWWGVIAALGVCWTASAPVSACGGGSGVIWFYDPAMTGGSIQTPTAGALYPVNSQVTCTAVAPTDQDRRYDYSTGQTTYPYDTFNNADAFTWNAVDSRGHAIGSFPNGNTGATVVWQAPEWVPPFSWLYERDGEVTIRCTIKDDAVIPPGEGGTRDDTDVVRAVTITVYGIALVGWETINSTLDVNPGGGTRIYPCKQSPTDGVDRRTVRAKAIIVPELSGVTVYFKSFDVDDPSANSAPLDANDGGGQPHGNDNRGVPQAGTLSASSASTNASGQASVVLTVTMQPGDNFRVGASLDQGYLDQCGVVGTATVKHSSDGNLPTAKGKVTGMLTVWRRLHVEVDSMGQVVGNTISGHITDVSPDLGDDFATICTTDQDLDDSVDRFEGGVLTNSGLQWEAVRNTNGANFSVTVRTPGGGNPPYPQTGPFVLVDDDAEPMPHQPDTGWLESRFEPAYVTPVVDGGGDPANNTTNVEFDLNVEVSEEPMQVYKGIQCVNQPDFWSSYLQAIFQRPQGRDNDPNVEQSAPGSTPTANGSLIAAEVIRDSAVEAGVDWAEYERKIVVHEIGHQFGAVHGDLGIMDQGFPVASPWFSDITLDRIRSAANP